MIVYAYPHHALPGRTPPGTWSVIAETGQKILTRVVGEGYDIESVLGPRSDITLYNDVVGVDVSIEFRVLSSSEDVPAEVINRYMRIERSKVRVK